jgi:hypothetical protein
MIQHDCWSPFSHNAINAARAGHLKCQSPTNGPQIDELTSCSEPVNDPRSIASRPKVYKREFPWETYLPTTRLGICWFAMPCDVSGR